MTEPYGAMGASSAVKFCPAMLVAISPRAFAAPLVAMPAARSKALEPGCTNWPPLVKRWRTLAPRVRLETFVGGPQGGLAVNVGCAECDSWWNLTVITEELLPDRVRGPAVVWVHHAISKPPEGTRRTEPGPLFEVAKPAPRLEPKHSCSWYNGTGSVTVGLMTGSDDPREIDCLCWFLPAGEI